MVLRHRICIRVRDADGTQEPVVTGGTLSLRERLLRWLLGAPVKLLVITPGDTVETVEIHEIENGG